MDPFDYFEEIAGCSYLFLEEMAEPRANQFKVRIVAGRVSSVPKAIQFAGQPLGEGFPVDFDETSPRYEVVWPSYVLYQIVNESYAQPEDLQQLQPGRSAFIYAVSRLLDYVSCTTVASDDYPGKLIHFRLLCELHTIDVISVHRPQCRKIEA